MPRKSRARAIFTGRWIRWFLFSALTRAIPALGRRFNFPLRRTAARQVASEIFEDRVEPVVFDVPASLVESVLRPAQVSDAGDTSGYILRTTTARRFCGLVEDCLVTTLDMRFLHRPSFGLLDYHAVVTAPNQIKPTMLRPRPARADVSYVLASFTSNYYHFVMDVALPLVSALRRFSDRIGPVVMLIRRDAPRFAHEIVAALQSEFPRLEIEEVDDSTRIEAARALFVFRAALAREWAPFDREDVEILARALRRRYALPPAKAEARVYVSRGRARLRGLRTEAEVVTELNRRGFSVFTPSADNHAEQVKVFGSARIIVAVHGAALTNLLFAPPEATVVELFPRNHIKSPYLWIARGLGLNYVPVIGGDADARQAFSLEAADVLRALEGLI